MTLYDLNDRYRAVMDMMQEEGIDQEAVLTTLEAITDAIEEKAENYAIIIKELESEAEKLKKEEDRLKARRQTNEKNIEYLKWNLRNSMELTGNKKFKTDHFAFSIQKNGGKAPVIIEDPDALPEEFKTYTWKPDLDKLRNYLEINGEKVSFAHIGERGESLRIR